MERIKEYTSKKESQRKLTDSLKKVKEADVKRKRRQTDLKTQPLAVVTP